MTLVSGAERTQLGKDAFLQLLVTQLRHQDPLSPLQPHEFAAQLAQFSAVEQLGEIQDTLALQQASAAETSVLGRTTFSAALIGRQVTARGDQVTIGSSGPGSVRLFAGGAGGKATVTLHDASGREVARHDLGSLAPGHHTLALPADLPPGTYSYKVKIVGADGQDVPVATFTTGVVTGVSFEGGVITLRIGSMEVKLDDLLEVAPAAP